ncbi:hypothetical protein K4G64_26515, partial [Streptomyces sp. WAC04114]|nr:hypothetical protein [Streptomyces sp. WAC04114]
VESLAFPSPANAKQMVVVRFGVDADQKETVLDDITKGIKVATAAPVGRARSPSSPSRRRSGAGR